MMVTADYRPAVLSKERSNQKEIRGLAQTWFEFDQIVQQQAVYELPYCLTRTIIDSHGSSLPL